MVAFTPNVTVSVTDPDFIAGAATSTSAFRLNAHDEPKQSASDDFESAHNAWTNAGAWSVRVGRMSPGELLPPAP